MSKKHRQHFSFTGNLPEPEAEGAASNQHSGNLPEPEAAPAGCRYFLGHRKSIVTRGRGIIHEPGAELFASDFELGMERLEDLASCGILVKQ